MNVPSLIDLGALGTGDSIGLVGGVGFLGITAFLIHRKLPDHSIRSGIAALLIFGITALPSCTNHYMTQVVVDPPFVGTSSKREQDLRVVNGLTIEERRQIIKNCSELAGCDDEQMARFLAETRP